MVMFVGSISETEPALASQSKTPVKVPAKPPDVAVGRNATPPVMARRVELVAVKRSVIEPVTGTASVVAAVEGRCFPVYVPMDGPSGHIPASSGGRPALA